MFGTKTQTLRIESEIDRSREEGNWTKVMELADQLKVSFPSNECLANFLSAEGKLESFLEQNPPIDANIPKAKAGLNETEKLLLSAANQKDKQLQSLDAHLLLGKLYYAKGSYSDALFHYNEAELHTLTEKPLASRNLRIIAESFAIKGLCLEKTPPSSRSKFKISEWQDQMINCFEIACDLTLLYLQEQDRIITQQQNGSYSPQPSLNYIKQIGPILETALQRAPVLHIQTKNIKNAIERHRGILSAVESTATQSLRLTLTRQLAEIILRGVRGTSYSPPDINAGPGGTGIRKIQYNLSSSTESPWKPKKYTGPNLFIPTNENEEIILLLLISEAMAVRDAVLSQSQEFREARLRAFENATAVYDLLSVVVVRWNQVDLLHESFERAMKFSHGESHVWVQYALCLINMGRYIHAYTVLQVVIKLAPNKVMPYLLAARLCYEQLNMIQEGIEWSKKALSQETANPQGLQSRCFLYIGIGYSMIQENSSNKKENVAFDYFHKAQQSDPNDHLAEYYLAHEYATKRQINEALIHVKTALSLRFQHIPSLHLFALLLTAQKKYTEALDVINSVLLEYPDNLNFLYIKAHLELYSIGGEVALTTIKHMLFIWKTHYECQILADDDQHSEKRSETRSVFQLYTTEMSDRDSNSLRAQSIAASRVEQTLSEVASSFNSFVPKPGPQKAWLLQLQVWLLLTEVYLVLDEFSDATSSLQEASTIFPLSHHVMYTRGLLHEYKMEYAEAKQCYQNAISINPSHIKSLQHLGLVYHYLGSRRLAEKTLRDAEKLDPYSHQTWYNLGEVLESLGEVEAASEYISKALDVELTNPILPIPSIPVTFE